MWQKLFLSLADSNRPGDRVASCGIARNWGCSLSEGRDPLCVGPNRLLEPPDSGAIVSGSTVAHDEVNALIAMSRVKHIHFASRDTWAGSADLVEKSAFLRRKSALGHRPRGRKAGNPADRFARIHSHSASSRWRTGRRPGSMVRVLPCRSSSREAYRMRGATSEPGAVGLWTGGSDRRARCLGQSNQER